MEVLFLLFIALATWVYFSVKRLEEQENKRQQKVRDLYEEQQKIEKKLGTSLPNDPTIDNIHNARVKTREYSSQKRVTVSSKTTTRPTYQSQQSQETNARNEQRQESLDTGIQELDGPGMFHRLTGIGPSASAVYLLYSKKHNAYKVGYCEPRRIANRIKQIKPEVPDIRLDGTAVFTSAQNAFDAEQKILDKYKGDRYKGITGRWSGSTEWITKRPTGKPYLVKPSKVEKRYQEELAQKAERPIEQDIYTVYLMRSTSKGMYKASWCKTENLRKKLRTALNEFANDVEIISRFPIQAPEKARAVAIEINQRAGTFKKAGRKESFMWTDNPSYLKSFKDYGPDAKKLNKTTLN